MREELIRKTWSVCPVCLRKLPARLVREAGGPGIHMRKTCPEHGDFSACVWKDLVDHAAWTEREAPLTAAEAEACSGDCRACAGHAQGSCCVLLEVTARCNLRCRFCFADGGGSAPDPAFSELTEAIDRIVALAGAPLLQFSGGEPTLREDLPELVAYAKRAGCSFTQINTNGIRLGEDESLAARLADSGLDVVFLQFDGTEDGINRTLRGRELLLVKKKAIENCGKHRLGVTLVPTVVPGVNDRALGDIVRLAAELSPAVRGVHFQPVTYLGRVPGLPGEDGHYTLDQLLSDLWEQTGLPPQAFLPSRCDHALCGFHAAFYLNSRRELVAVSDRSAPAPACRTDASRNREYVARHWSRPAGDAAGLYGTARARRFLAGQPEDMDFDTFVRRLRHGSLTLSAMDFQDALNLDLERLYRCSLHVYRRGRLLPFCAGYLTPVPAPEAHT